MFSQILSLINGKIYVSFKPLKTANGITLFGDKILYVGSADHADILAKLQNGKVVDLDGKVAMPGFIDSHLHLDSLGIGLNTIDMRNTTSIKDLQDRLKKFAATHPEAKWIRGRGWDQESFEEGRWPNKSDLDEVVSDKPVLLIRTCGHAAVVNSKTLELLKGLSKPLEPPEYDRDNSGELTGIVREDGVKTVRNMIIYTSEEYIKFLKDASDHAFSNGVTTVAIAGCISEVFKALHLMLANNELRLRVRAFLSKELLPYAKVLGIARNFGHPNLKISGVKVLADGSLGARTALLSEPYSDDPSTSGVPTISEEELHRIVKESSENELQVAAHGIGDKSIDQILNAYEAFKEYIPKLRHRIEHTSVIRPDQIKRMAKLGVGTAVQPHFIPSDWWAVKRVGVKRAPWVYPFKTLLDAGIRMGFSTDCPVEPLNPWLTVYAAVTRGEYEGIELSKYTANEKLDVATALHLYTQGSAQILHEEKELGTLEEGKFADLIIIDKDPLQVEPRELKDVKVLGTIVGGIPVYVSDELHLLA